MHILVVDDDAVMRELLQYFLEEQGLSVSTASNPPEALQFLEHNAIDLVLSDLVMPGGGGKFLIKSIQLTQPKLPVIVMSGYGSNDRDISTLQTHGFWRKGEAIDRLIDLVKTVQ